MKQNGEWERKDLEVDQEMEVLEDGRTILVYIDAWFDVDKKFGTHTADDDSEWVTLYARLDPFADTLEVAYIVSRDDGSQEFPYTPSPEETRLVKEMITEKIKDVYGQTPKELCMDIANDDLKMEGIS